MNNKAVVSSTIGYMAIGLTLWMGGMLYTGWFPLGRSYEDANAMLTALGIVILGVIAILSFFHGRTLDSIIFFGIAGLFLSLHVVMMNNHLMASAMPGAGAEPNGYHGWFDLAFAVFFFYVWLGSFRSGSARMLFLLTFWLALLASVFYHWTMVEVFTIVCGYLLLITAILAIYISAAEVINHGNGKVVLPAGSHDI